MKDNINTRTAQVLINNEWVDINPIEIKKGMTFRMFESDGVQVVGVGYTTDFVAESDAYYMENGVISVKC
jgi:hypothetical protein